MKERIQKVLSRAGLASRRNIEKMIDEGRIEVNGEIVRNQGIKIDQNDFVKLDGKKVNLIQENYKYILFNKPKNTVTTLSDEFDRPKVIDFIGIEERVYPVGRLDFETTGALLMTNDGELANNLTHPSTKIKKIYKAKVKGNLTKEKLERLRQGIKIDGKMTAPAIFKVISKNEDNFSYRVKIIIHEGRNRQIRRMFEEVECNVVKLHRDRIDFLNVRDVRPGEYRELTDSEITILKRSIEKQKIRKQQRNRKTKNND